MINKSFWKGKRVLITGHTGFKGGWLSIWIKNLGAQVIGYSLSPITKNNFFDQTKIKKIFKKNYIKNIQNINDLEKYISPNDLNTLLSLLSICMIFPLSSTICLRGVIIIPSIILTIHYNSTRFLLKL